jgi:hypothetical protein
LVEDVKRQFYLIVAIMLALALSGGLYAYTYLTAGGTLTITELEEIATCNVTATQPGWNSVLETDNFTEILRPNSSGNYTECEPFGDSPNYQCVDEVVSDNDSTYIRTSGGATEQDTYNIPTPSEATGTINSVKVYINSRGTDTGNLHAASTVILTNGANYTGTYTLLPLTYTVLSTTYTNNPYTNNPWTWDEIEDLEIGVRHYDNGSGYVYTTQVYVEVNYGILPLTGEVSTGDLFTVIPSPLYSGDLQVDVYLNNAGSLIKAYQYLNMEVHLEGSVSANQTPNHRLITLQNGRATFTLLNIAPAEAAWTQTSQADFEAGTLYQVDTTTSPGDVLLDTFSDNVSDDFADESKIASKTNLVVTGGQVKLTSTNGTETLRPNAAGTYTQCDPIGDTANYLCVDEAIPDDDTTYVRTTLGATELDTYNIPDHSEGSGAINSVKVYIRSDCSSAAGHQAQTVIRTNGTDYFGTWETLVADWAYYSTTYTTNPYTTNAWTWDEIDAMEIGVRQDDTGGGYPRTTQVYVEVDYTYYDSPGILTSINLLSGETVKSIDSFGYTASAIPSGTGLKVQFSTDNTTWYNSAGTPGGWDTMSQGTHAIDLSGLGWSGANFYYKMEFTSDGNGTPVLDEIIVNFSSYYTSGTLTSSAYDSGWGSDWSTISFTVDEPSATDIKFQIRTAATQAGLSTATWYGPTGTTDYYQTSGNATNPVHDGDQWIQYKAYFSDTGDDTPTLSDVSITYTAVSSFFTLEVIGGGYGLVSENTSDWGEGWTVTPEFYCEATQR